MAEEFIYELKGIRKRYVTGNTYVRVLTGKDDAGIDFKLKKGEFAVVTGSSGSGKSTLLNILGLLDTPTFGRMFFKGVQIHSRESGALVSKEASAEDRAELRNSDIGFVFQQHHLLPDFTVLENVSQPAKLHRPGRGFRVASETLCIVALLSSVAFAATALSVRNYYLADGNRVPSGIANLLNVVGIGGAGLFATIFLLLLAYSLYFTLLRRKENIAAGSSVKKRALELLDIVGLKERAHHFPNQLSGGERQRCAIARALMNSPEVLLCDEPAGNLDHENGIKIIDELSRLGRELNKTVVLVTHEKTLIERLESIHPTPVRKWYIESGDLQPT
ncbi:MAG: ABC transporter ATP-binding protein [Planctomycetes bacterium]|nr:ABC transporter ATP-binding protein [Planctomycetota bacterium]